MEIYFVLVCLVSVASAFRGNAITDEVMSDTGVNCQHPLDVGTCEGQEEAWYYRPEVKRCAFFVYSGCGGNGNRFSSQGNCEAACMSLPRCPENDCPGSCTTTKVADGCDVCACTKQETVQVCSKPIKRGYCRALQYKWAGNAQLSNCTNFIYGGCGGNENNFETEETCNTICRKL